VESFKSLKIWRRAVELSSRVLAVTAHFTPSEREWLTGQIRQEAATIPSDIASWHLQRLRGKRAGGPDLAYRATQDLETNLRAAHELGYLTLSRLEELLTMLAELRKMISAAARESAGRG